MQVWNSPVVRAFIMASAMLCLPSTHRTSAILAEKFSLQKRHAKARNFLLRMILSALVLVATSLLSQYTVVRLLTLTPIDRRWFRMVTAHSTTNLRELNSSPCVAVLAED